MSSALTAFRPKDDSLTAVRSALAAVATERQAAEQRLVDLRTKRGAALLDPTVSVTQLAALENEAREVEVHLERLAALRPGLEEKLVMAQQAARQAQVDYQVAVAREAIATYKIALAKYATLASQIAAICALEREAQSKMAEAVRGAAVMRELPNPVASSPPVPRPAPVQMLFEDLDGFHGHHLADLVVLPSQQGTWWGRLPPTQGIYAPVSVVA